LPAGVGLFPPSPGGGYGSQQMRDNATIAALSAPQNSLSQTLPPRNAWGETPQNSLAGGQGQARPVVTRDEFTVMACLYRFGKGLQAKGLTVDRAFVLHDMGRLRSVDLSSFANACEQNGIPISKSESQELFTGWHARRRGASRFYSTISILQSAVLLLKCKKK